MAPSTLIHNACVWIWDSKHVSVVHGDVLGHIRSNCYLTVHNGYISHVSQENELPPDSSGFDLVINANMRLILPGLMGEYSSLFEKSACCCEVNVLLVNLLQILTFTLPCLERVNTMWI